MRGACTRVVLRSRFFPLVGFGDGCTFSVVAIEDAEYWCGARVVGFLSGSRFFPFVGCGDRCTLSMVAIEDAEYRWGLRALG